MYAETTAEVGTIAGIVSAVGMALVGAISSYISYQKKKFCFSVQRKAHTHFPAQAYFSVPTACACVAATESLNAEMVKADAPDAVLATEPQGSRNTQEGEIFFFFRSDVLQQSPNEMFTNFLFLFCCHPVHRGALRYETLCFLEMGADSLL